MPLLDVGYRGWEGDRTPRWTRSLVLASTGIHLVWQGTWLKRILMFAVIPALIAGGFVAVMEQTFEQGGVTSVLLRMSQSREGRENAERMGIDLERLTQDPEVARHYLWSYILFMLFSLPPDKRLVSLLQRVLP